MYENGKQVNRYAAKMIHKRRQKNLCRRKYFGGIRGSSWEDYVAHLGERDSLKYYLSGPKGFAKRQTNRVLRSRLRKEDHLPQGAEYRKYFDYWWAVL